MYESVILTELRTGGFLVIKSFCKNKKKKTKTTNSINKNNIKRTQYKKD